MVDFILIWMIGLPMAITGNSDFKIIRIFGILLMFPWIITTILPFSILLLLASFCMLIEES